ncbi:MAG: KTSC domain-containing protein [Ignavibacteriae bacterium]|nr:KTSC domain-containing protein [Ignavibacteriota bacterium]MCB9216245.1 KTSC domain-containing protein [Ignavibacteria bacterium]
MHRVPVSSSNVISIGYDSSTSTLEVEFHGGRVYQYHAVPESVYHNLMSAASIGSYINHHIKNTYAWTRVS